MEGKKALKMLHNIKTPEELKKNLSNRKGSVDDTNFFYQETALTHFTRRRDESMMKILLEHHADPNAKTKDGTQLLVLVYDNIRLIRLLLDYGANPESSNKFGETVLHLSDDDEVVQLMCEKHANPNLTAEKPFNIPIWEYVSTLPMLLFPIVGQLQYPFELAKLSCKKTMKYQPLHRSRSINQKRMLLEAGADPRGEGILCYFDKARFADGILKASPANDNIVRFDNRHVSPKDLIQSYEELNLFLDYGLKLNQYEKFKLMDQCGEPQLKIFERILADSRDIGSYLVYSVRNNYSEDIIEKLVQMVYRKDANDISYSLNISTCDNQAKTHAIKLLISNKEINPNYMGIYKIMAQFNYWSEETVIFAIQNSKIPIDLNKIAPFSKVPYYRIKQMQECFNIANKADGNS